MRAYIVEVIRDGFLEDGEADTVVEKVGCLAESQQEAEDHAEVLFYDHEFNFGNTTVFGLFPCHITRKQCVKGLSEIAIGLDTFKASAVLAGGRLFYEGSGRDPFHARCRTETPPHGNGTTCLIYNDEHWVSLPPPRPRKSLYIGNLSWNVSSDHLFSLFEDTAPGQVYCAQVSCDREEGRSRGFGFVEMETDPAIKLVMDKLEGRDFMGRKIQVSLAKERKPKPRYAQGKEVRA